MDFINRIYFIFSLFITFASVVGCVPKPAEREVDVYHAGSWSGKVFANSILVVAEESQFSNSAWKLEANISLDEYDNNTFSGTATTFVMYWNNLNDRILDIGDIAVGNWDFYTQIELSLSGEFTDDGYIISVDSLPDILVNPSNPGDQIVFYDFLFPAEIDSEWLDDTRNQMRGSTIRPSGEDYAEVSNSTLFRVCRVDYSWEIDK